MILPLTAGAQELLHASLDSAGGRISGGTVVNDATLGSIGGEMHEGEPFAARPGFAGQLWDAIGLEITPQPAAMNESSTLQLAAQLSGDDGTAQVPPAAPSWETGGMFLSIDASGLATSSRLPGDQSAAVGARSGDLTGSAVITLFDLTPDDYGPFASDDLDDGWQWKWFGDDPASGAPGSDPDHDGQANTLEFLAGTVPLDGASFLQVWMEPQPSRPAVYQLFFAPFRQDRIYRWEWSGTLEPVWQPVVGEPPVPSPSGEARATDEEATGAKKFYRLWIE